MLRRFKNRIDAGRVLSLGLAGYANRSDVVVLALPRGGVPVGFEVALALNAPLDVFMVRKLGAAGHPELAMGAIASGGVRVLNRSVIEYLGIPDTTIDRVTAEEKTELERCERAYRDDHPPVETRNRAVILVDDGLATGSTIRAAIAALKQLRPSRIVVAVPVGPSSTCEDLREEADEVVCSLSPDRFDGVGRWYDDFSQTSDDEVQGLLEEARCMATSA